MLVVRYPIAGAEIAQVLLDYGADHLITRFPCDEDTCNTALEKAVCVGNVGFARVLLRVVLTYDTLNQLLVADLCLWLQPTTVGTWKWSGCCAMLGLTPMQQGENVILCLEYALVSRTIAVG